MEQDRFAQPPNQEIDLAEVAGKFWRHRKLIAACSFLSGVCALAVSFALPRVFEADATILPNTGSEAMSSLATGLASQIGVSGFAGVRGGRTGDLVEILSSRSMASRVIDKLKLDRVLLGWNTRNELLHKLVDMRSIVSPTSRNKSISIRIEASSATLSASIADAYVTELKGLLDEMGYNDSARTRREVEKQLGVVRIELEKAEDRLAEFSARNKIASLPETIETSIRSIADLESQNISTEAQLEAVEGTIGAMRSKISSLLVDPSRMTDIEIRRKSLLGQKAALDRARRAFAGQLSTLPAKGMALARLQRDVQVNNSVFLALTQQHQAAIIAESRETDAFMPLDRAVVPDRPIRPRKRVNTLIGIAIGLLVGAGAALFTDRQARSSFQAD